jgi:hypothetical protein
MRRLLLATASLGALAAVAVPATAQELPKVSVDTHNGVAVGVTNKNEPVVSGTVTPDGRACVGVSYQVPVCTGR